jgi:hypothetical protein
LLLLIFLNLFVLEITVDQEMAARFPDLLLGTVEAEVVVTPASAAFNAEMEAVTSRLEKDLDAEAIRRHPVVAATKNAYRLLGKDPNRYRPAAESLLRRIASGKGLYRVNNVVDVLNRVSVETGFSIGGYDSDKIVGQVALGIGEAEEAYVGIGRGDVNIERCCNRSGVFSSSSSPAEVRVMCVTRLSPLLGKRASKPCFSKRVMMPVTVLEFKFKCSRMARCVAW